MSIENSFNRTPPPLIPNQIPQNLEFRSSIKNCSFEPIPNHSFDSIRSSLVFEGKSPTIKLPNGNTIYVQNKKYPNSEDIKIVDGKIVCQITATYYKDNLNGSKKVSFPMTVVMQGTNITVEYVEANLPKEVLEYIQEIKLNWRNSPNTEETVLNWRDAEPDLVFRDSDDNSQNNPNRISMTPQQPVVRRRVSNTRRSAR